MLGRASGGGDLSPAEAEFVEFLAAHDPAADADFEAFLRRHPGHTVELRRLHREWLDIARVLGNMREESPAAPTIPPGAAAADRIRIDSDGEGLQIEMAGELIRRLAAHRSATDRYETRGELARGGMGVIWRSWDPILRRNLAMKVILARREEATPIERERAMHRALGRFLEEAQITSQLDHPGIVPIHDLGIDSRGRLYFTMRLVRGRDFRSFLEQVRKGADGFTLVRALGVVLKVCEAVAYAHSKGVVHRDLKPANVMVGRFGEVYVMDWGLARVLGRDDSHDLRVHSSDVSQVDTSIRGFPGQTPGSPLLTMDGRVVGTPSYMSPEQAKGRVDELGPRSDVYAIGAMLYHLLTGQMPYVPPGADVAPITVYSMLLAGPPTPIATLAPGAPHELIAICGKAMARDPEQRYASPLDLAADVEAFLGRRPVKAKPLTLRYVARLFVERNQALTWTAAAALVVLGAVTFSAWRTNRDKQLDNERLLDLRSAQVLAASIEELFPAVPANAPAMRRWLATVDELLARAPAHRSRLAAARAAADRDTIEQLEPAVRDLDRLESTLRPQVAGWCERAEDLARVSLDVDDRKWREAIDEIATLPTYGGLKLAKQLGLVPLRRDPGSGLWEFWHVLSGERPAVDPADPARYVADEGAGIVLVLIPGATAELGWPPEDLVPLTSSVLHEARLAPVFIAKHEVTQAQWLRAMHENPSLYQVGYPVRETIGADGAKRTIVMSGLNPVESVDWDQCARFVRRLDLELPAEDAWEHAARGGAQGLFWWEPDRRGPGPIELGALDVPAFEGRENLADARCNAVHGFGIAAWDDGWPSHAPVGSFAPNSFGLHDVLGNVSEWCADLHRSEHVRIDRRIVRGGNWLSADVALHAIATRAWDNPRIEQSVRGLRVARSVR